MRSQNVRVKNDVAVPLAELAKEAGMSTAEYLDTVIRTHLGLHTATNVFRVGEIVDGQHRLWKYLCYCVDYECNQGRDTCFYNKEYKVHYLKVGNSTNRKPVYKITHIDTTPNMGEYGDTFQRPKRQPQD